MLKIIFLDIDGTLKKHFIPISKKVLLQAKQITENGAKIILTTGRSINSAHKYLKLLTKYCAPNSLPYCIFSNGGDIYEVSTKNHIHSYIEQGEVNKIIKLVNEYNLNYLIYNEDSNRQNAAYSNSKLLRFAIKFLKGLKVIKIKPNTEYSAFKIVVYAALSKKIHEFYEKIKDENINISFTTKFMLEINNKNINKGYGVNKILDELKIEKNDTCSIGDSPNDIPMFDETKLRILITKKDKKLIKKSDLFFSNLFYAFLYIINYDKNDKKY